MNEVGWEQVSYKLVDEESLSEAESRSSFPVKRSGLCSEVSLKHIRETTCFCPEASDASTGCWLLFKVHCGTC